MIDEQTSVIQCAISGTDLILIQYFYLGDMMNQINPELLMEKFREASDAIGHFQQSSNTVILLGATGSEKSTISLIMNKRQKLISCIRDDEENYDGQGLRIVKDPNNIIGNTYDSQTDIPKAYKVHNHDMVIWDTPGYSDSKGINQDIINSFYLKKIFDTYHNIKLVFVASYDSMVTQNNRGQAFITSLNYVAKSVMYMDNFEDSISLVVTNCNPINRSIVPKQIKNNLICLLNSETINSTSELHQAQRAILQKFLKEDRITYFEAVPNDRNLLNVGQFYWEETNFVKDLIRKIQNTKTLQTTNFRAILPDQHIMKLAKVLKKMGQKISKKLQHINQRTINHLKEITQKKLDRKMCQQYYMGIGDFTEYLKQIFTLLKPRITKALENDDYQIRQLQEFLRLTQSLQYGYALHIQINNASNAYITKEIKEYSMKEEGVSDLKQIRKQIKQFLVLYANYRQTKSIYSIQMMKENSISRGNLNGLPLIRNNILEILEICHGKESKDKIQSWELLILKDLTRKIASQQIGATILQDLQEIERLSIEIDCLMVFNISQADKKQIKPIHKIRQLIKSTILSQQQTFESLKKKLKETKEKQLNGLLACIYQQHLNSIREIEDYKQWSQFNINTMQYTKLFMNKLQEKRATRFIEEILELQYFKEQPLMQEAYQLVKKSDLMIQKCDFSKANQETKKLAENWLYSQQSKYLDLTKTTFSITELEKQKKTTRVYQIVSISLLLIILICFMLPPLLTPSFFMLAFPILYTGLYYGGQSRFWHSTEMLIRSQFNKWIKEKREISTQHATYRFQENILKGQREGELTIQYKNKDRLYTKYKNGQPMRICNFYEYESKRNTIIEFIDPNIQNIFKGINANNSRFFDFRKASR